MIYLKEYKCELNMSSNAMLKETRYSLNLYYTQLAELQNVSIYAKVYFSLKLVHHVGYLNIQYL